MAGTSFPYQENNPYFLEAYATAQGYLRCRDCGRAAGIMYYTYEGLRGWFGLRTRRCPPCSNAHSTPKPTQP